MYKLLIVDDEQIEREGMAHFIQWDKYDIQLCGTAWNGADALGKIQKDVPDIVLTDIKMPVMNGIELIQKLSETYRNIVVVVLSGYGEYEFTSQAMEYGIRHYILKPCDEDKIVAVMNDAKKEVDKRREYHTLKRELLQNEAESNTYYFDFDRLKSSDRYDNILFEITLAMKKLQSIGLSNDEKQRIFEAFIVTWSSYVGSEKLKLLNIGGINSDESAITEMSRWIAETLNIYETGKEKERMEKILDVIYSNFDNTELNIQYIAKNILFMNEDYFGRVFIRNMHLKFSAYLEQSRIEMAKRLLEYNPDMRIAMLTELIGYPADGQYFSKTFRKVCGMTPTEYRENLKKTDI